MIFCMLFFFFSFFKYKSLTAPLKGEALRVVNLCVLLVWKKKEACAVLCVSGQRGGNEPARAAEPDGELGWGGLR